MEELICREGTIHSVIFQNAENGYTVLRLLTEEGEAEAKKVIQSIAQELKVDPVDFTYELGEEEVTVTPGHDGQELDTDALLARVEEAFRRLDKYVFNA